MNPQKLIPLAHITVSTRNPRKNVSIDDPGVDELSESIQAVGLLHPVLVREIGRMKYELLCGQRRFLAATKAGMTDIPATIADLSDEEALDVMVTENMQRADLSPLEEGRAVASMLETRDVSTVAGILAKSPSWVRRRGKLVFITPSWLVVMEGTIAAQEDHGEQSLAIRAAMTAGHLELIAHFPPETQDAILREMLDSKWRLQRLSLRDFRDMLAEFTCQLGCVPWEMDDATLGAMPCADCQSRSDREPDLFAGVGRAIGEDNGPNVHCLDKVCFKAKQEAFIEQKIADAKKKTKKDVITISSGGYGGITGQYNDWQVRKADKGDQGAVPAIRVDGPNSGALEWVIPPVPRGKEERPAYQEPEATLEQKRLHHQTTALVDWLNRIENCPGDLGEPSHMLAAVSLYGIYAVLDQDENGECIEPTADAFAQLCAGKLLIDKVWPMLQRSIVRDLTNSTDAFDVDPEDDERRLALALDVIGLDRQQFLDDAFEAFPDETPAKPAKKGGKK